MPLVGCAPLHRRGSLLTCRLSPGKRLGSGSQIQYVEVLVSTASTYAFAISPAGCPPGLAVADCGTSRGMLYDYSKSSTWKYSGTNFSLGIEDAIGLDSNGYTGFEDQSLGFPGSPSSTAQINGSLLNTVADPLYWTGILGLNPRPTNLTQNFDNSTISFVQALKNAANIPSLSWAYGEGAKYREYSRSMPRHVSLASSRQPPG